MFLNSARTGDTSSCLLLDFDNASVTQDGKEKARVSADRIVRVSFSSIRSLSADLVVLQGTPMFIARAVSLGHIL